MLRLAACVLLVALATARAATPPEVEARDLRAAGTAAFARGDFEGALQRFEDAYRTYPAPELQLDIGSTLHRLGNDEAALRSLKKYLEDTHDPASPRRAEATALVDGIEQQMAKRHFALGADFFTAGDYRCAIEEFEAARALRPLPAFDYNIGRCYERLGDTARAIAAYERYVVSSPPDAAAVASHVAELRRTLPIVSAPPPPRDEGKGLRAGGIATGAVGVAALGVGVALAVLAQGASSDLTQRASDGRAFDPALESTFQTDRLVGGVLLGVGAALVVTGVVLWAVGHRRGAREVAWSPSLVRF